jgi:hypothetical protein
VGALFDVSATVFLYHDGKLQHNNNHTFRLIGSSASRFRFSNRKLDRNAEDAEFWLGSCEDSNSFEG